MLVERKSLGLWTKIKLLVKVKLGLPTNKTKNKEDLIVDKDISSLEHTRWRCQYHVVFAPKYRKDGDLWRAEAGYRVYLTEAVRTEGDRDHRGRGVPRSHPHADQHPAKDECIPGDGIPERKKLADHL